MSGIKDQEANTTIEDIQNALFSEVGKAEGESKTVTMPAEKEKRSAKKSPSREFNAADDLKTTLLNLSKQILEPSQKFQES